MVALDNYAEVELSKLAAEKASSDQVKQFAQTMVKAHTQYGEKLKQFAPGATDQLSSEGAAGIRPGAPGQIRGQAGAGQAGAGQAGAGQLGAGQAGGQWQAQLLQIGQKCTQNKLQLTKEMLEDKQGAEFDKGYIGTQVAAHINALATHRALEGVGSEEFQQVVQEGTQHIEQHLKQAQAICETLESQPGQARPGQPRPGQPLRPGQAQPGQPRPGQAAPERNP
jgi:predicted outer membrane protein